MLTHFLIAIGGMLALIALWTGVQLLVRRQPHQSPEDCELLACSFRGKSGGCVCGARLRLRNQGSSPDSGSRAV